MPTAGKVKLGELRTGGNCSRLKKTLNPQLWKIRFPGLRKLLSMALENHPSLDLGSIASWTQEHPAVQALKNVGPDPRNHSIAGSGKHTILSWTEYSLHD